jgi:HD superfamily phosphohydrolase
MENIDYPARFGEYVVDRALGAGGAYGVTFLVHDAEGKPFALKWMKPDAPREGAERFENEIWALKKLKHPFVPRFFNQGELNGRPYIVMSFASGKTLRSLLDTNRKEGGLFSQLKVALIAEALLETLSYMHSVGIIHRDVKDDNVIISLSGSEVTLIDLGVCKGDGLPAEGQTFWNAGASRFSPPAKLEHPTLADPRHDVFALGVLCYLLLTNDFPWSVEQGEDSGHLRVLMLDKEPIPVRQLNSLVDRKFSDFISELLDTRDHHRPTAEMALVKIKDVRQQIEARAPSVLSALGAIRFPRVVRDALHGDIPLTELEVSIINTKEFQKLRRIRQLGFSYFAFPGAEHSRFTHAIGTMHVADTILNRIETQSGVPFDNDERLVARTFALIHDIGHIAFGHTLEDELNFFSRHDLNERRISRILRKGQSEIASVLEETEYGRVVIDHLLIPESDSSQHSWISELVSAPSGADVLDYIDRDSLFCGLDHRVDSAIFRQFSVEKSNSHGGPRHLSNKLYGRHGFRVDAEYALLSLLRERFSLFMKVYTHTTKASAGAMIGKALFESKLTEEDVEGLGDEELLMVLRSSENGLVKKLAASIVDRRLYKPAFRTRALRSDQRNSEQYRDRQESWKNLGVFSPAQRAQMESNLAKRAAVSSGDIIIYVTPNAPGAQKIQQNVETAKGRRVVRDEIHRPHREIFRDHLSLWNAYVFVNPELAEDKRLVIGEFAEDRFQMKNEIQSDRRQLLLDL